MSEIPDCQIGDWLIKESPEFRAAIADLSPKCWARYDLSACRVGWELHKRTTDAELERLRTILRQIVNDLPTNRDWLDPDVERVARAALKQGG